MVFVMGVISTPRADAQRALADPPERGVALTPQQQRTIQSVHPWLCRDKSQRPVSVAQRQATLYADAPVKRTNASGSRIQGWRTPTSTASIYETATRGWYEVNSDGSQKLLWEWHDPNWEDDGWSDEPDFPFGVGFVRNGKIYGFHAEMLYYWLVWGHGIFTFDGQITEYQQYGDNLDLTTFDTYVISCAYDEQQDVVYAYTLNADASAYMVQKVNPDTWEFTPINTNVSIDDLLIGVAYNPADKEIYGMTPDSRFVKFNKTDGSLSLVKKHSLPVTTALQGMTYSPLDGCFYFVYTDGQNTATLYTIDPATGEISLCGNLEDTMQYRILVTPDKLIDKRAPQTPKILSADFPAGSRSGVFNVQLPTETFGGETISGEIALVAYVDGAMYRELTGQPGSTVDVGFTDIEEGSHTFAFSAKQGDYEGASVDMELFVGFDTPLSPKNLELSDGTLTWDPVTEGIKGGYIDAEGITYNVYLNDNKVNAEPIHETSYTFTMPEDVYQLYTATVEADNHSHISERGISNAIKYGNPYPLPYSVTPTGEEGQLIINESVRNPYYWWTAVPGEYFSTQTTEYENEKDEYFFLPGVIIPETDKLIEISYEVIGSDMYGSGNRENLAVVMSPDPSSASVTVIAEDKEIQPYNWTKKSAWCLPAAGKMHFGFRTTTHSGGEEVRVRNIRISVCDRPATTPSTVTSLTAEALPQGQLKANVKFTMPTLSAAGQNLSDGRLTATVTSAVETKSVSGAPGSEQSVEIATQQGLNQIAVHADNAAEGIESSVTVYTGKDVPSPLTDLTATSNEDFSGIHLTWEAPQTGANGGYVNPSEVTYILCTFDDAQYAWIMSEDLGNATEYDYLPEPFEGKKVVEVAILTQNDLGNCGTIRTASAPCGTPYELPMTDSFSQDNYGNKYAPYTELHPDESYKSFWSYNHSAFPYFVSSSSPEGNEAFIATGVSGDKARIGLPSFSTEGLEKAGIELMLYGGEKSAPVRVYAAAYGIEPFEIGYYDGADGDVWKASRFDFPSQLLNRKWVTIYLDAEFAAQEETTAAFASYRIQRFYADDINVKSVQAPSFPLIGRPITVEALVENLGSMTAAMPVLEMQILKGEETVSTMTMSPIEDLTSLKVLESTVYKAQWTPGPENTGDVIVKVRSINADMNPDNDVQTAVATVAPGKEAVVTDLSAEESSVGVLLAWTDPYVETGHESFEGLAPFSYAESMGDFKAVKRDNYEGTMYFGAFRFPHDNDTKAWQVIGEKEIAGIMAENDVENIFFNPTDGNNLIAAFTPISYFFGEDFQADDWLISPEVKGGSSFSFDISAGSASYYETVEVLYSTSDDNPDSFTLIEEIRLISPAWKRLEYTLPEDARYFAIRYRTSTKDGFFAVLDNIEYVPAEESPVLSGYDIYRNGALIAEAAPVRGSYTDNYDRAAKPVQYNVKPVISRHGVLSRGFMSNTALLAESGVQDINADSNVFGADGYIVVTGKSGTTVDVYRMDGIRIASISCAADFERIPAESGIYLVKIDGRTYKVIVD